MPLNPYGQFLRMKRNCTTNTDFEENAGKTKLYYTRRGYPEALLDKHLATTRTRNRADLLKNKEKETRLFSGTPSSKILTPETQTSNHLS